MPAARPFTIAALAVCGLAAGWLLVGAQARQVAARTACPDWPECFRPTTVAPAASDAADGMALALTGADALLGVCLAALAVFGWRRRAVSFDRRWAIPVAGLLALAGAVGARLADTGPPGALWQSLAAHVLAAMLWWLALREGEFWRPVPASAVTRALRPRVLAAIVLALVAIAAGGWATAHGIGLPCPDFPACRGEWWPAGSLWAALTSAARPDLEGAMALAVSHRFAALLALIYVAWLGLHVWRVGVRDHLCRYGLLALATLLAAAGLGIMGAVTRLPPATVLAHGATSVLLLLSLVTLYHAVLPNGRPEKRNA